MIAALYVDLAGPYPLIPDVDYWDESRDARLYSGPWACVAHPPCADWGGMRQFAKDPGGRRELAPLAVEQVRHYGGVLEHPRGSTLWRYCRLPLPGEFPDRWGGQTLEVYQRDWGHEAMKPTWLYCVRCLTPAPVFPPRVVGTPGAYIRPARNGEGAIHVPKSRRHLTPPAFALWLVELARRVS